MTLDMRVAIVVPRYGLDIGGGAAVLAQGFAEEGVRRGWQVEVWTTRSHSHYEWRDDYPAGAQELNGVTVHRFPITQRPQLEQARREHALVSGPGLMPAEQYEWLHGGVQSAPLYAHIAAQAPGQDVVLALPYATPLIHYASWSAPEQIVLWPCLHDEPYAYMETTRLLLEETRGVLFNAPEEAQLALERLRIRPRRHAVLGSGVIPLTATSEATPGNNLLYVGRLEQGKNLALLYEYVRRYADAGGEIQLHVAGKGPFEPPRHRAFTYLGFVSDAVKAKVLGNALALCQPSLNESFSLTVMESWLARRPVLVHGNCTVTQGHVRRSQGGLWFHNYDEFVAAVRWLQANPALAMRMGANGRRYVQRNYTWPAITARFESLLAQWQEDERGRA